MSRRRIHSQPLSLFAFQDIITSVTGVFVLLTLIMALALTRRQQTRASNQLTGEAASIAASLAVERMAIASLKSQKPGGEDHLEEAKHTPQTALAAIHAINGEIALLRADRAAFKRRLEQLGAAAAEASSALNDQTEKASEADRLRKARESLEVELRELRDSKRVFYNRVDQRGRRVILIELFYEEVLVAYAGQDKPPIRFQGESRVSDVLKWADSDSPLRTRFMVLVHRGMSKQLNELTGELRDRGFAVGYDLLPESRTAIDSRHGAG